MQDPATLQFMNLIMPIEKLDAHSKQNRETITSAVDGTVVMGPVFMDHWVTVNAVME